LFPLERTFAHALVILSLVFVAESDRVSKATSWFAAAYSLLILFGLVMSYKVNRSILWEKGIIPNPVFEELERFQAKYGAPILISEYRFPSNWEFLNSMNQSTFQYFPMFENQSDFAIADYLLISKDNFYDNVWINFDTVCRAADMDYVLLRKKRTNHYNSDSLLVITDQLDASNEYTPIYFDTINPVEKMDFVLNLQANLILSEQPGEVQIVIEEKSSGNSSRLAISLDHYFPNDELLGVKPYTLRIPFVVEDSSVVSVYFWNVDGRKMIIRDYKLSIESRKNNP
jgi:hypothetical protein